VEPLGSAEPRLKNTAVQNYQVMFAANVWMVWCIL